MAPNRRVKPLLSKIGNGLSTPTGKNSPCDAEIDDMNLSLKEIEMNSQNDKVLRYDAYMGHTDNNHPSSQMMSLRGGDFSNYLSLIP